MLQGTLDGAQAFNAEWTADEQLKWKFMDEHRDVTDSLHQLEDLTVIRGRLFAFELEADTIRLEPQRSPASPIRCCEMRSAPRS